MKIERLRGERRRMEKPFQRRCNCSYQRLSLLSRSFCVSSRLTESDWPSHAFPSSPPVSLYLLTLLPSLSTSEHTPLPVSLFALALFRPFSQPPPQSHGLSSRRRYRLLQTFLPDLRHSLSIDSSILSFFCNRFSI